MSLKVGIVWVKCAFCTVGERRDPEPDEDFRFFCLLDSRGGFGDKRGDC